MLCTAFVILAASSGVLADVPGAKELLDDALALYDLRFWNEEEGLSCDTWNTEFTVLDDYRGLNANMHTVEAFLAAADVTGDEKYRVEQAVSSITLLAGHPQTTGESRNTSPKSGLLIWNATKIVLTISSNFYGATPVTASDGPV